MFASRLVYNTNGWTNVSGEAERGVEVVLPKKKYYFGLEEWMNNKILIGMNFGYIDSYRKSKFPEPVKRIILFMYNKNSKQVFYVGNLYDVRQLTNEEINSIRTDLVRQNWLNTVQVGFNAIGDNRHIDAHTQYMRCWNSNQIVGEPGESFILNIQYKKFTLLKQPINLTKKNPEINRAWRYLCRRYKVRKNWEEYFTE